MRAHFTSIPALVKNAVVQLFPDVGLVTESNPENPDIREIAVVQPFVNRLVANAFRTSAFQTVVKQAVHECLAEPHFANDMGSSTVDLCGFMVPVAKLVKKEVEMCFLEKAEVDRYQNVWSMAIVGQKAKAENGFLPQEMDSARSSSSPTDISDDKQMNPKAYSNFMFSDDSDIRRHDRRREERMIRSHCSRRQYCSPTPWRVSEIFPRSSSKYWYRPTRGTKRPLRIALVV